MTDAHNGDVIRDRTRTELGELTVNDRRVNHADRDHLTAWLYCRTADKQNFWFVHRDNIEMVQPWENPFRVGDTVAWGPDADKPDKRPYRNTLTEILGSLGRAEAGFLFGLERAVLVRRPALVKSAIASVAAP